MENPLISIVTPSYQQAEFLEETIISVLDQGYEHLEYIIIDGGSTDGSKQIIERYSEHLKCWVSEKDNGQSHAINKGLERSEGQIITWLNSDDRLKPGVLHRLAELHRPNVSLYYGDCEIHDTKGNCYVRSAKMEKGAMLAGMPFAQPSTFFNGALVRDKGLRVQENLHFGMDYHFFLQLYCLGEFEYLDMVASEYLIHEQSKSHKDMLGFAREWYWIYSSFIRKVKQTGIQAPEMIDIEDRDDKKELAFKVESMPERSELESSYLLFLENQFKFRYNGLDMLNSRKILRELRTVDPAFYTAKGYQNLLWRTYLPAWLMKGLRS